MTRDLGFHHAAATHGAGARDSARWLPRVLRLAGKLRASLILAVLMLAATGISAAAPARPNPTPTLTAAQTRALVERVLATEVMATQDTTHPMRYRLRKRSPRLATTKLIVESRDGDVARLIAINDQPLNPADQAREQSRLQALVNDPDLQRHRQQREEADTDRARKILRALPGAFVYTYAGVVSTAAGPSYRLTFQPNPAFDPEDIESQLLKAMAGELWIDIAHERVTRLACRRIHDVDYMGGILGELEQGGTLEIEQTEVADQQWRITRMVLVMNARLLLKVWKLDTTLELSDYSPVASGLGYKDAVRLLNAPDFTQRILRTP